MSVSSWGLYRGRVRERPGGTVEPWLVEEGGGDEGRWKEGVELTRPSAKHRRH